MFSKIYGYLNNNQNIQKQKNNQINFKGSTKQEIADAFVHSVKNRNREAPSFANINLMGKCNLRCFFCIGNELQKISEQLNASIAKISQMRTHFKDWLNFEDFLQRCHDENIKKVYLTGMNTDPSIYKYLPELIEHLKQKQFKVGIRTNGYFPPEKVSEVLPALDDEISYSIQSFNSETNKKIIGTSRMPDWDRIIPASGDNVRVAVVVNRYNKDEIVEIIERLSKYKNVRYIQLRSVCTDLFKEQFAEDNKAFSELMETIGKTFPKVREFKGYPVYNIHGKDVSFWDPLQVSVNSLNYFSDGTISSDYFVTEGYSKSKLLK